MDLKQITPDNTVFWQWGLLRLNATIVWTWVVMAVMIVGSWLLARRLRSDEKISRWQNLLEILVDGIRGQIREITGETSGRYLPFLGTLFLFIAMANLLSVVPGFEPPTASLSTTAALAICVFVAVPVYGVVNQGWGAFLKHYVTPSPVMLPFHIIGELSRTLALAVRLFGNVMSGAKIVAVLLAVIPFIFPVFMNLLGLLTGMIQAYIFAVLAAVYIASGTEAYEREQSDEEEEGGADSGEVPARPQNE